MLFERIFRELNAHDVHYVVIGGLAVNLHGYIRATADLDIVISLWDHELTKFIAAVKKLGLVPRVPVALEDLSDDKKRNEWIHEKNMLVFTVYHPQNPLESIDVMIDNADRFDGFLARKVVMNIGDIDIPVISIPDLIFLKERAGRGRDMIDVKALEQILELKDEK